MMYSVEEILDARPYKLTLKFNTGEVRCVDLEPVLRAKAGSPQSAYRRLLDPGTFIQGRLDRPSRSVCWDGLALEVQADGTEQPAPLDFCPDTLYELGRPVAEEKPGNLVSA
jgi:hypothetical protein